MKKMLTNSIYSLKKFKFISSFLLTSSFLVFSNVLLSQETISNEQEYLKMTVEGSKSLNSLINNIKKKKEELDLVLKECRGKSLDLKSFDVNRIQKMSNVDFVNESTVRYLGKCQYEINHNVIDYMYGNQYNFIITYKFNEGDWDRISSTTYRNEYGRWVEQ